VKHTPKEGVRKAGQQRVLFPGRILALLDTVAPAAGQQHVADESAIMSLSGQAFLANGIRET